MLRLLLLLVLLTDRTRTAFVTNPPTFADRLDKLYEKLERLTLSPIKKPSERLYEKLDRLNSLKPDKEFSDDDDEELLSAMQLWVPNMTDEQWQDVVQELQNMKTEKSEKNIDDDDVDDYSEDEDSSDDYVNDVVEELDAFEDEPTTSKAALVVTPSAFTRLDVYRHTIISAVASIAATKERPRILDDSNATTEERKSIRQAALSRMGTVVKSAKCLTPQPRWLSVRKLAPAADTMYMPPCVQLHRCAPDSGCCYNEEEVCAPVEGKNVAIPFLLNKADGKLIPARMMFFNHTRCECVSRETLETTSRAPISRAVVEAQSERFASFRASTEEPLLERDEEQTAPPQLLRCTCPVLFRSHIAEGVCSCTCDWMETSRRRDCLSLSRGREHFGLRDRVCIERGECNKPACASGSYDAVNGKCPHRFKRQSRRRSRYQSLRHG